VSWHWFGLVEGPPAEGALASAEAREPDGTPAGFLAVWPADRRPKLPAVKLDARVVDPAGAPATISLVLAPPRVRLLFDDTAVQQARRDVLAGPSPAGDLDAAPGRQHLRRRGHRRPGRRRPVRAHLPVPAAARRARPLRQRARAPGTDIERHGSGAPWPYPSFA
jgi:hypothetical protein